MREIIPILNHEAFLPREDEETRTNREIVLGVSSQPIDDNVQHQCTKLQTAPHRPIRNTRIPRYLTNYHIGFALPSRKTSSSTSSTVNTSSVKYPLINVSSCNKLMHKHRNFTTSISTNREPSSMEQNLSLSLFEGDYVDDSST